MYVKNKRKFLGNIAILSFAGLMLLSGCRNDIDPSSSAGHSISESIFISDASNASTSASNFSDTLPESSQTSSQSSSQVSPEMDSSEIGSSETETTPALSPEELALYTAYQNALTDLLERSILPDGKASKSEADFFMIQNVDDDETEELILAWTSSSSFGNIFHVYQYDIPSEAFHVKWNKSSSIKLYDKDTVLVPVPVNYGLSSTDQFYPYGIYQYNKKRSAYTFQAYVDAWQKSFLSTDYDGNPYPSNIDTDNAGLVYCISYCNEGDDYVNDYNYSQAQYDLFCNETFGTQITINQMKELSIENIKSILAK